MIRRTAFISFCAMLLLPSSLLAASIPAGIQGTLWFSEDPLPVGKKVEVFAMIYNSGEYDLSGEVTLMHGTTTLDTKPFTAPGKGASVVVAFPFFVTPGTHTFSAHLGKVVLMSPDSSLQTINPVLSATKSDTEKRTAIAPVAAASVATGTEMLTQEEGVSASTHFASTNPSTIANEVAHEVAEKVAPAVPDVLVKKSVPVVGALEQFRSEVLLQSADRKIAETRSQLPATKGASTSPSDWKVLREGVLHKEAWTSPLQYVSLFLLLVWKTLLAHPVLWYSLLLIIAYRIARAVLGVLF